MTWQVKLTEPARKELRSLDPQVQGWIIKYLSTRIATEEDPRRFGKVLTGSKAGLWRYRVGDYRIICSIEDQNLVVLVVQIGHRKEVYD